MPFPPLTFGSSFSNDEKKKTPANSDPNKPLLKIDAKFELVMHNGELDAEKLDNWLKQIEVYYKIQQIVDESTKVQLATFCMGSTSLIWQESKTQNGLLTKCKVITYWYEFIVALKKQFYPLGHMKQAIMDWKNLRQAKGQNVREYTRESRKKALDLGIPLYTQETLLKYIGGLLSYLRHVILTFNPTNFDEVCV